MKVGRLTAVALMVLATVVCAPGKATASDKSDVMAVINGALAAFNKGDMKGWEALCTPDAPVVDNIPPYEYASCADWWNAHAAFIKKNGVSGEKATLQTAWTFSISGDRAYAAIPTSYTYKQKGKTIATGGILTIALQKTGTGWLMTGWSWSQRPVGG
jgi:ketosteroid isomerase-like protein